MGSHMFRVGFLGRREPSTCCSHAFNQHDCTDMQVCEQDMGSELTCQDDKLGSIEERAGKTVSDITAVRRGMQADFNLKNKMHHEEPQVCVAAHICGVNTHMPITMCHKLIMCHCMSLTCPACHAWLGASLQG